MLDIRELFRHAEKYADQTVEIGGWVRTIRDTKAFGFIECNDGTFFKNVQIVFAADTITNYKEIAKLGVGTAIACKGRLVLTPEARQPFEIKAEEISEVGSCPSDYPLQKKRHSFEFLRQMAPLRPRTNTFAAVFRVRSLCAYAIHKFFRTYQ